MATLIYTDRITRRPTWPLVLALVALLSLMPLTPRSAQARVLAGATRTVTTLTDSGAGSLRQTIADAAAGDTITFAAGLTGTINLKSQLTITRSLTIAGPGQQALTLQADAYPPIRIMAVTSGSTVTIRDLTFQNGGTYGGNLLMGDGGALHTAGTVTLARVTLTHSHIEGRGGAVYNAGTLTLVDATLTNNVSSYLSMNYPGHGGAMYNAGTLAIHTSTLADNYADTAHGGAVYNAGTLTIRQSTFVDNRLFPEDTDRQGGSVYSVQGQVTIERTTFRGDRSHNVARNGGALYFAAGTLVIRDSTFTDFRARERGGAIHAAGGSVTIQRSTVANNQADHLGGGIYNEATLTVEHTTVSNNDAGTQGGGIANRGSLQLVNATVTGNDAEHSGGGIIGGTLTLANTIVAGNRATSRGTDVYGSVTSHGYNLIGVGADSTGWSSASGDRLDVAAHLGPLAYNGGPTPTHTLLADSPAIDSGNPRCAANDQRGFPRPSGARCDRGALELGASLPNGTYRLTATHSGKVLDVAGVSTADGAPVHQWTWGNGHNQKWLLERLPDGAYKVTAKHSSKVLEVYGGGTADGTPIAQWAWHGGPNQRWWIEGVGADTYRLVNVHSGKVLEVSGGSTADGAGVHQWTWVTGANQQWVLTPVQ
jgi:hypothetical protein